MRLTGPIFSHQLPSLAGPVSKPVISIITAQKHAAVAVQARMRAQAGSLCCFWSAHKECQAAAGRDENFILSIVSRTSPPANDRRRIDSWADGWRRQQPFSPMLGWRGYASRLLHRALG